MCDTLCVYTYMYTGTQEDMILYAIAPYRKRVPYKLIAFSGTGCVLAKDRLIHC